MTTVIPHWLSKQAYLSPNKLALDMDDGKTLTFSQLETKSKSFARKLANFEIMKGDRIGIFSNNSLEMIIAIHALSYLGAVSVLLNVRLTKAELAFKLADAEVSLILTDDPLQTEIKAMKLAAEIFPFSVINQFKEGEVIVQKELRLGDPFIIMYTSGTTGSQKGVIHTYGNYWWSAIGSALNLGLHTDDKWLAFLPFYHVGGLAILIRSAIYGIPIYLLDKFSEERVHEVIMHQGITIVSVVTALVQRLLNTLGDRHYSKSFRCMLLCGRSAPTPLLEAAKKVQIPIFQSYGMTETTSQIVTLSPEDALEKIGSAGKPLFPAQLKINHADQQGIGE